MIIDRGSVEAIIDRAAAILRPDEVIVLRDLIRRVDELDDLVDAVCACRTQEIPILRPPLDDIGGRP